MKFTQQALGVVAGMAVTLLASTAHAQIVSYNFDVSDGGWTSQTLSGTQNWSWSVADAGWRVGQSISVGQVRLLSPLLRATGTLASMTMGHRYNFETATTCFDGGNWKLSANGSAFTLGQPNVGGYTSSIFNSFGNPMAGQSAWCSQSTGWANPNFVSSQGLVTTAVGDIFQFAFDASWDASLQNDAPNWEITSIELSGFEEVSVSVVPEPTTYATLAAGLAALIFAARGRRKIRD